MLTHYIVVFLEGQLLGSVRFKNMSLPATIHEKVVFQVSAGVSECETCICAVNCVEGCH